MKIIKGYPPNIEEIRKYLVIDEKRGVVFAYGDTIYSPKTENLTPDLIAHEMTHLAQQKGEAEKWWQRYLLDEAFRASQEIPAYQTQYQFARKKIKDKNRLNRFLVALARDLSSDLYGKCMTFDEAYKAIQVEELFAFKTD